MLQVVTQNFKDLLQKVENSYKLEVMFEAGFEDTNNLSKENLGEEAVKLYEYFKDSCYFGIGQEASLSIKAVSIKNSESITTFKKNQREYFDAFDKHEISEFLLKLLQVQTK